MTFIANYKFITSYSLLMFLRHFLVPYFLHLTLSSYVPLHSTKISSALEHYIPMKSSIHMI